MFGFNGLLPQTPSVAKIVQRVPVKIVFEFQWAATSNALGYKINAATPIAFKTWGACGSAQLHL